MPKTLPSWIKPSIRYVVTYQTAEPIVAYRVSFDNHKSALDCVDNCLSAGCGMILISKEEVSL